MKQLVLLVTLLLVVSTFDLSARNYPKMEEAIAWKSQTIAATHPADHDELAQLYTSRGEYYMLNSEYQKALDDFQAARMHSKQAVDPEIVPYVEFWTTFEEVICHDNLDAHEALQDAILRLQAIVVSTLCEDCLEEPSCPRLARTPIFSTHYIDRIVICANTADDYSDILGPNEVPPGWCEEIVKNTVKKMRAIAEKATSYTTKHLLLDIVKQKEAQGCRCCRAGKFWKSCVAPIVRQWKEWNDFYEKFGHPPLSL